MRHESKHQEAKKITNTVFCRINVPYSIAIKEMYHFSSLYANFMTNSMTIVYSKKILCPNNMIHQNCKHFCIKKINFRIYRLTFCSVRGIKYETNNVILLRLSPENPMFGKICCIYVYHEEIILYVQELTTESFNSHGYTYRLSETSISYCLDFKTFEFKNFVFQPYINGNDYIITPQVEFI